MNRVDKVSLCITNYNRCDLTLASFANVLMDKRIAEIVICDDHSDKDIYDKLVKRILELPGVPVRVFRNDVNLGMSRNKAEVLKHASSDWCILFDSDNILTTDYLDAFYRSITLGDTLSINSKFIFMPSGALPDFDYSNFEDDMIGVRFFIKHYAEKKLFDCLINTCNYVVNRKKYLEVYEYNPDVKESDTIWFNYLWLKAGYFFYVVPGMTYQHRTKFEDTPEEKSGFLKNADYNFKKAEEIKKLILEL